MIMLAINLAIFCYMYCVPGGLGICAEVVGVSCGCLGLPLMFYITSMLWFLGVVPMINLSCSLAILLYFVPVGGGVGDMWACLRLWACPFVV